MGGEIAETIAPFGRRICIGLAILVILFGNDSLTSFTFFNYRFKKTLHDILLLKINEHLSIYSGYYSAFRQQYFLK